MSFMDRVKAEKGGVSVSASRAVRKPPCHAIMMSTIPPSYQRASDWDKPPEANLEPYFVYGYRSFGESRNNQFIAANGCLVFHSASIAVVYDTAQNTQTFFAEHEDDIWSLALHPNGKIAATGQAGKKPEIFVWDLETKESLVKLQGFFERQVVSLDFSPDGRYLVGLGGDDNNSVAIYEWATGKMIADCKGDSNKMHSIRWDKYNPTNIVCTGARSFRVLQFQPKELTSKRGVFGKAPPQNVTAIAFHPTLGTLTGCQNGDLMIWNGSALDRLIPAHKGQSQAVEVLPDGRFITGGDDGRLILWGLDLKPAGELALPGMRVRSIATPHAEIEGLDPYKFFVGCGTGETLEIVVSGNNMSCTILCESHRGEKAELWGLCPHPTLPNGFATAGDDGTVRVWDGDTHVCLTKIQVKGKARSVSISPDASLIAVGFESGKVEMYTEKGELVWEDSTRNEWISALKFSPDGTKLASGSHTNHIDVWVVTGKGMKKRGTCFGHSSYITHVDWSMDSKYLQSNSGDYELLYWNTETAEKGQIQRVKSTTSMQDIHWHYWSCKFGWWVEGIFPEGADYTDVNCAAVSHDRTLVVTGDDGRDVNLYRCPAISLGVVKPTPKTYFGHSEHVTGIIFTDSDQYVVSIGGGDKTIIQWKITGRPPLPATLPLWQQKNPVIVPPLALPSTAKPLGDGGGDGGRRTPVSGRSRSGSIDIGSARSAISQGSPRPSTSMGNIESKLATASFFDSMKRPGTAGSRSGTAATSASKEPKKPQFTQPPMSFGVNSFSASLKSTKYAPTHSSGGSGSWSARNSHPLGLSTTSARGGGGGGMGGGGPVLGTPTSRSSRSDGSFSARNSARSASVSRIF